MMREAMHATRETIFNYVNVSQDLQSEAALSQLLYSDLQMSI